MESYLDILLYNVYINITDKQINKGCSIEFRTDEFGSVYTKKMLGVLD